MTGDSPVPAPSVRVSTAAVAVLSGGAAGGIVGLTAYLLEVRALGRTAAWLGGLALAACADGLVGALLSSVGHWLLDLAFGAGSSRRAAGALVAWVRGSGGGVGAPADRERSSWLIASLAGGAVAVPLSFLSVRWVATRFHAPEYVAALAIGFTLASLAAAALLTAGVRRALRARPHRGRLARALSFANVLALGCALILAAAVGAWWRARPAIVGAGAEPLVEITVTGALVLVFAVLAAAFAPGWPVRRWPGLIVLGLCVVGLAGLGSLAGPRSLVLSERLLGAAMVAALQGASDVDGDGHGSLFGGRDCAPWDATISPSAREVPANGRDDNCSGGDAARRAPPDPRFGPLPAAWPTRPDFVLVSIDTLRADHVSAYGYSRQTTPHIDRLAARSTTFLTALAPGPRTAASVPSVLTGRSLHRNDLRRTGEGDLALLLPENVLFAEALQEHGYLTQAILSHRLFDPASGWSQGFASWDWSPGEGDANSAITGPLVTQKALLALAARPVDRPYLLWVHYYDPHARYLPHPGFPSFGPDPVSLYDGEILATDTYAGKVIEEALRPPFDRRTVLIVFFDHGEGLGEHCPPGVHHGLFREMLHVPLIVHAPGIEPSRVKEPVGLVDLYPTILNLAGLPPTGTTTGRSLLPAMMAGRGDPERALFHELAWSQPFRARSWVGVTWRGHRELRDLITGSRLVFDLASDPAERNNLGDSGAAWEADIAAALDAFIDTTVAVTPMMQSLVWPGGSAVR
ncbi:MAG: sulfatase-like hydrolase/transferase [Deltaproteobacteria bacterium]|nr:sulfatase-like hydrolase/transferase [Deltaproteobacteria bacterium]